MNPIYSDHITRTRQATNKLIDALNELRALKAEWDALDLGNKIDDGKRDAVDAEGKPAPNFGDFEGQPHLTKAEIGAVTGTTLTAIEELLKKGHATNLHRIRA